jgi:hypothetical protein
MSLVHLRCRAISMMTLLLLDQRNGPDRLTYYSYYYYIQLDTYIINFDVFKYSLFFIIVRAWLVFLRNRIIISFSYNCHIIYYILPITNKCYYYNDYTLNIMIQPLKKGTGPSCWPRSLGTILGGVRSPGLRPSLRTLFKMHCI